MPQFTSVPPTDPRGHSLELKRCPPGAPLTGIITCDNVVGCPTHFWGGRTVPHEEEECEPCLAGIGWLWHGYVSAYTTQLKLHFLFEMTARCVEPLTEYREANPTLRGCSIIAQRPSGKPNGRVYLRTKTIDIATLYLPSAPDLTKVLAMIWNLPAPDIQVQGRMKDLPALHVNSNGTRRKSGDTPLPARPKPL